MALAFYVAVSVWITWPLTPRFSTGLSDSPDSLLNAWALGWSYHALATAPLSLFDANIFAPRPDTLAYSEHMFAITALAAPVYAATNSLVSAYNAAFFASFVLSGLGMFLLTRELTRNDWAALAAGTIFLAAPYRFQHVLQLQLLNYQWFPFVFWSLLRYLKRGRGRDLVGVMLFSLLQILSCNYYAVYLAVAVGVFAIVVLTREPKLFAFSRFWKLVVGAVAVAVVALPFILPYSRNRDRGFYRRYDDVVQYSASPSMYLSRSAFNDAPHWGVLPRSRLALFPGFVAPVLALIGLSVRPPRWRTFWIFAIAIGGLAVVLSFGPQTSVGDRLIPLPYRLFQLYFPGFSGMRVPARFASLVVMALAVLAAGGATALLRRIRNRRHEALAGVALTGALLFDYQTSSLDRVFPDASTIPAAHRWLADAEGPGAVLVLPIHESEAIIEESTYMYYSTAHFKPLVNGYSGWWPNDYWEVVGRLRHFPTHRILRFLLERAPVRYVVIHYDRMPGPKRRQLEAAMERYRDRIPLLFRSGDDAVYEILE
jgi:hypothetical protein